MPPGDMSFVATNGASNGVGSGKAAPAMDKDAIDRLERELRRNRKSLTIWKHPVLTMQHFSALASAWCRATARMLMTHPAMVFFALPLLALWGFLEHLPGPYTQSIDEVEKAIKFVVWWAGLGVLSSVGLGTGMHTGVMFLFPHIMKVCLAAEECGTLDFEARSNMWLHEDDRLFSCPEDDDGGSGSGHVTFWKTYWKVYPACFLWGVGTAIGEIPPYAVSYAAKLAGEHVEALDELDSLGGDAPVGRFEIMKRMKIWMINFLQRHGFIGVFLMSAWPNMAFDLCGICCGHFLMSFWTFFGATLLGKAGVKVTLQAMFFTMLFSEHHLANFVGLIRRFTPASWALGDLLHAALRQGKARFHRSRAAGNGNKHPDGVSNGVGNGSGSGGERGAASTVTTVSLVSSEPVGKGDSSGSLGKRLSLVWKGVMVALIAAFAISCIEQFAQRRAAELDAERIRKLRREAGLEEVNNNNNSINSSVAAKKLQ